MQKTNNELKAQEFIIADNIIINNEETTDYILDWFDGMLDKLSDLTWMDSNWMGLGPMIYDIAEYSKITRGIFRYGYKESTIRFECNRKTHTVNIDLYMGSDILESGKGCEIPVVSMSLSKWVSIGELYRGVFRNPYVFNVYQVPNMINCISRTETCSRIVSEIVDFIGIMLYSVTKKKEPDKRTGTKTQRSPYKKQIEYDYKPKKAKPKSTLFMNRIDVVIDDQVRTEKEDKNRHTGKHHEVRYEYDVRGHWRHYKNGTVVFIKPQIRCKGKPRAVKDYDIK